MVVKENPDRKKEHTLQNMLNITISPRVCSSTEENRFSMLDFLFSDYSEAATKGFLYKKSILKNFGKFTGKYLRQSLFFNKVAGLRRRLWHRCFPMNFAKFLETPFLQNTSGRMLLIINFNPFCLQTVVKIVIL